jgi:hypothetical protein
MQRKVIALAGLLFLAGCSDDCNNTPVTILKAPDGLHTAIVFQRDCGATTDFSTQISVLTAGENSPGNGTVFIADTDNGAAIPGNWGDPQAEITWIENDHLIVRYAAKSRIFKQDEQVSGVTISYEQAHR